MTRRTVWSVSVVLALASPSVGGSLTAAVAPNGGTIAIEPEAGEGDHGTSAQPFVDAASEALTNKGFTILNDPAHAAYVAELTFSRVRVGTGLAKDPHGDQIGIDAGVVVPFSTGESKVVTLVRTKLDIQIRKRGDPSIVWNGEAVTVREAGTRNGAQPLVASLLSNALLHNYPAQPKTAIGVP